MQNATDISCIYNGIFLVVLIFIWYIFVPSLFLLLWLSLGLSVYGPGPPVRVFACLCVCVSSCLLLVWCSWLCPLVACMSVCRYVCQVCVFWYLGVGLSVCLSVGMSPVCCCGVFRAICPKCFDDVSVCLLRELLPLVSARRGWLQCVCCLCLVNFPVWWSIWYCTVWFKCCFVSALFRALFAPFCWNLALLARSYVATIPVFLAL